jgi:membrane-associated phospholipid phosphatase
MTPRPISPPHLFVLRPVALVVAMALAGCACSSAAQGLQALPVVVPGERLSDWLVRNLPAGADLTSVHWRVNAERGPQTRLRDAVLAQTRTHEGLAGLLGALPVTGRLSLAHADARWLQAAPSEDPVLQEGHTVVAMARPTQVAVLTADGGVCLVAHRSGALAPEYLQACGPGGAYGVDGVDGVDWVDWVWAVQPDGRVQRLGVAPWSLTPQTELAPGAWLWAPRRAAAIADNTSDNLARWLATQLPAEFLPRPQAGAGFRAARLEPLPATPQAKASASTLQLTASDWGEVGLLQTPSARMAPPGEVRSHLSATYPYVRGTVMLQPLDWLEAGFRYTDIADRLYGVAIAGSQTYKDKSIDLKLRLREESATLPQLALGLRDIGGTGLFSGEYLVASKRSGPWDLSAGLGWGYMGGRGHITAPLGFLGEGFKTRPGSDNGNGGTTNFQSMFHGNAALFGGVQWQSPAGAWVLKAELDGNDYRNEPLGTSVAASSPVNLGLVYRYSPYVDLSVGWEHGNRAMLGLTLHAALSKLETPKVLDQVLARAQRAAPAALPANGWAGVAAGVERHTGWSVQQLAQQHATLSATVQTNGSLFLTEQVERAATVLHQSAPAEVGRFVLDLQQRGLALSRVEIDRNEWAAQHTQAQAPALRLEAQQTGPAPAPTPTPVTQAAGDAPAYQRPVASALQLNLGPSYSQILGGPDGFLLYQLGLQAKLDWRLSPTTWLAGAVNARLLDNYANFVYDAPSDLPRVRTHMREYVTTSRLTLPLLQLTHVQDLGHSHYLSAYAGMLEPMYAGAGAEWLYRPWRSPLALGVDVNHVRQRNYAQDFGLGDYAVNTGHASVYWDTGWNDVQLKLQMGRYLAGDTGATLDVKRTFSNGVAIGAWATKTNVSAEQFGEGSFDKGIYVSIPFDLMLPKSNPGVANAVWTPLTRDGGARLNRSVALFDVTRQRDARTWSFNSTPSRASPANFRSAESRSYVLEAPAARSPLPSLDEAGALARSLADVPWSTWLLGAGVVGASSLLDGEADQWAQSHQGESWSRLGKASNALPYALALGAGVMATGWLGEPLSATARSSLAAAAYTLGGNLLTKYAVGRARPLEALGAGHYEGLGAGAAQSSFASNHVALAFALVTPFAQQYSQPWLYAVAASTAYGRIQSREHWASDTVAGALLGYAMGSLVSEQQRGGKRGLHISATPQSVQADWVF